MTNRLKSLRRHGVLCLAFLACAFALGNTPVRADGTETVAAPSQFVDVAIDALTPYISGSVERRETCTSEGCVVENCIENPTIVAESADQDPPAMIEVNTRTETDPPLLETGAAIVVEITQTTTIAAPGQVTEEQDPTTAVNVDPPIAQTGSAIVVEITQSVIIATRGQVAEDENEAINVVSRTVGIDPTVVQTVAAIVVEIKQSVTLAVQGQLPEDNQDQISVAAFPDDED
jgi:hypothetical protein